MSDTHTVYVERPRRNGCLWGCLGVLVLVSAPLIFAWGYSAWFLYTGFRDSPMMRTIVEMTQRDGLAQQVLGPPITVVGLQGNVFSYIPGRGTRDEYTLLLQGARAMGTLSVATGGGPGRSKIQSMILTGPDGRRYDLLTDTPLPGNGTTPKPEDTI